MQLSYKTALVPKNGVLCGQMNHIFLVLGVFCIVIEYYNYILTCCLNYLAMLVEFHLARGVGFGKLLAVN